MPAFDSRTTRMPNGVTNASPWQTMGASGIPDPSWAHVYHNDFDTYAAADWLLTPVGTITEALAAVPGGALLITTDAVANDGLYLQLSKATFDLAPGKAAFFKLKCALSDVINSTFWAGLVAPTATPATPADGIYINKPAASAQLYLVGVIGGVNTFNVALPASQIPVNATQFELGISVDYLGNVAAFFNPTTGDNTPVTASSAAAGQARGYVAAVHNSGALGSLLTGALLSPAVDFTTTAAAAKTLTIDYITAVRER